MILDSSAIIGIIAREQGTEELRDKVEAAPVLAVGAPTLVETANVLVARFDLAGKGAMAQFLDEWDPIVLAFEDEHWRAAGDAFIRFGKGRHPARLNFGDCMTYAVAKLAGMPLLYLGEDFAKTDLVAA